MDRVGRTLDLPLLTEIAPERAAAVDAFVDPSLHRSRGPAGTSSRCPSRCATCASDVWGLFLALAGPEVTPEYSYAQLDEAHEEYRRLYARGRGDRAAVGDRRATAQEGAPPRRRRRCA